MFKLYCLDDLRWVWSGWSDITIFVVSVKYYGVQDGGGLGVPGPAGYHHGPRLLCHGLHHISLQPGIQKRAWHDCNPNKMMINRQI